MATVNYGETDRTRGVLTYSTSQTATEVTLTARTQLQAKSYGYSGYRLNTILAGTTVSTKLGYIPAVYANWTTCLDTGEYSKTYTRTHSAQTVTLKSEYKGEGTGDYYAGGKSGETTVTITIPAKSSYTISYNANSGSGAPASQTKWYGENLTLSSTVPTRTNYKFLGWATTASATTAQYSAGGTYSANAAATLYAVWQLNGYTVSYNKGANGTGTNTTDTKIHGTALTLKGAIFTRTGYSQTGWSTTDGGAKTYNLSASYTANAAVTLYPYWSPATYTISYDANRGTGAPSAQTKTYNVALTLSATRPTRANERIASYTVTYNANTGTVSPASSVFNVDNVYTFMLWNTAQAGTGTDYYPSGSYTANASATLYAQWEAVPTVPATILPTPTKTGYTFTGWYTASSGGTRVGGAGDNYSPTKTITLYAHWTANTYAVTYNKNTTDTVYGMPSNQTKTYGVDLILSSAKPTRTDYLFRGWATSSSATTPDYLPSNKYTGNSALTLYAIWQLDYSEPKITGTSGGNTIPAVFRSNSSGTAQDDGTYARVEFRYQTFSSRFNATKIEIFYKLSTASAYTIVYTDSNPGASSGTVRQTIGGGNIGTENSYLVKIRVTDENGHADFDTFISSAFLPIDLGTAGKSLGFGMSATDTNVPNNGRADFGMDVHLQGEAYYGNIDLADLAEIIPYKAGDTYSTDEIPIFGYMGNSSKSMIFAIPLPRSMSRVSPRMVSLTGQAFAINGIIDSSTSLTDWLSKSDVTVTPVKRTGNMLRLVLTKTTAYQSGGADSPLLRPICMTATFSLSFV